MHTLRRKVVAMVALFLTLALAQQPADLVAQQRDWLVSRLSQDMLSSGKYDAAKLDQATAQLDRMSPAQVAALVDYYHRLSQSQQQALGQATTDLNQAVAQRDQLRAELAARTRPPFALGATFGAPLLPSYGFGFGYGPQGVGYGGLNPGYGGFGGGFGGYGAGFGGYGAGFGGIGYGYGAPPYAPGFGSPMAGYGVPGAGMW